jgi:hypothetical protein
VWAGHAEAVTGSDVAQQLEQAAGYGLAGTAPA